MGGTFFSSLSLFVIKNIQTKNPISLVFLEIRNKSKHNIVHLMSTLLTRQHSKIKLFLQSQLSEINSPSVGFAQKAKLIVKILLFVHVTAQGRSNIFLSTAGHPGFYSNLSNKKILLEKVIREQYQICKQKSLRTRTIETKLHSTCLKGQIKAPFIILQGSRHLDSFPYYHKSKLIFLIISFTKKKKYSMGRFKADILLHIDDSISKKTHPYKFKKEKSSFRILAQSTEQYTKAHGSILIDNDQPRYLLYKNNLISARLE